MLLVYADCLYAKHDQMLWIYPGIYDSMFHIQSQACTMYELN